MPINVFGGTKESMKDIEMMIKYINDNVETMDYIDYNDERMQVFENRFYDIWDKLTEDERNVIVSKYYDSTESVLLKTLLLKNDLPKEKEKIGQYLNTYMEKNVQNLLNVWERLSEENKVKIIKEKPEVLVSFFSKIDLFEESNYYYEDYEKNSLSRVMDSIPYEYISEQLITSILNAIPDEEIYNEELDISINKRSNVLRYLYDKKEISAKVIENIIQNSNERTTFEIAKNIPNSIKTQELFDLITDKLDVYAAVASYGANFVPSSNIEEILAALKDYDEEIFIKTVLTLDQSKQTRQIRDMFLTKITQLIEESLNNQEISYSDEEYMYDYEEDEEYYENSNNKDTYINKLYEYLNNIAPELLTTDVLERIYEILPEVWKYIPQEKQTDELFEYAINKESNIYNFWKNTKNKNILKLERIINRCLNRDDNDEQFLEYLSNSEDIVLKGSKILSVKELKLNANSKALFYIWDLTEEKNIDMLQVIIDSQENTDIDLLQEILYTIDKNDIKSVEKIIYSISKDDEEAKDKFDVYKNLRHYNEDINSSINLNFFDEKYKFLSLEDMVRISAYKDTQKMIIENKDNDGFMVLFKKMTEESENTVATLGKFQNKIKENIEFNELINNREINKFLTNEENGEVADSLLRIILNNSDNYFQIDSIEKLKDYKQIRNSVCLDILNGKNIDYPQINDMSSIIQKKFAILELLYGIDYEEANNLSMKYGKDINEVSTNKKQESENVKEFIKSINEILNLDEENIEKLLQEPQFIQLLNDSKARDIDFTTNIENRCIDMYSKSYKKSIFNLESSFAQKAEHNFINEDGAMIETVEISPEFDENGRIVNYMDFMMLARVEGAYVEHYIPPEDYSKYFDTPKVSYHGNCESLVSQDLLAFAAPQLGAVTFGYSNADSIIMQAPWDIVSSNANAKLDTVNSKYDTGYGICFRSPRNCIDNTRHTHNEVVSERVVYDEENNKIIKRKPAFVIFCKEEFGEMDGGSQLKAIKSMEYEQAKKAATQLNIPIVIIDRKNFAIQEEQKINDYLEIFEGKKENDLELDKKELLSRIICGFENNRTGIQFSRLERKFFTDEKREKILNRVIKHIIHTQGQSDKIESLGILKDIINQEKSKTLTSIGKETGYEVPEIYLQMEEKISEVLEKSELDKDKNDFIDSSIKDVKISDINKIAEVIKASVKGKSKEQDGLNEVKE